MRGALGTLGGAFVVAALLIGCGGGGGSGAGGADYAAKYVGTWETPCWPSKVYDTSVSNALAYEIIKYTFGKASDTTLNVMIDQTLFASTDESCVASPIGHVQWTGTGEGLTVSNDTSVAKIGTTSVLTIVGQTTVDGKPVDKVTMTQTAPSGSVSTNDGFVTVGRIKFGAYMLNPAKYDDLNKDIFFLNSTNTPQTITRGDKSMTTEGDYPTLLSSTSVLTKK